jgi:hypothetical protein
MRRVRDRVPRGIIGISICPRFLGAAVLQNASPPVLRPTRIAERARERVELARLGAWAECLVAKHRSELIVIVTDDDNDACLESIGSVIREVAHRQRAAVLEVSRPEVARVLGLRESTSAVICSRLVEDHPAVAENLRARGVRSFFGPRSEAARYWTMPLLAFGAALYAVRFVTHSMPS